MATDTASISSGTGAAWRPSPFHPPTIYDAPRQAISSILEGEATLRGSVAALLSPNEATPRERQTFADTLKAAVGQSRLGHALVDIVTNPWVWAMAITSPLGARTVTEMFRSGARFSEFVINRAPFLGAIGALSPTQVLGTTATAAVHRFEEGYRKALSGGAFRRMNEAQEAVVRRYGLDLRKGLNWQLYADGSEQQRIARTLSSILDASMDGTLTGRPPPAPRYKHGKLYLGRTRGLKIPFNEHLIEAALRKYGLEELRAAYRGAYRELAEMVFQDPDSVMRLFRSTVGPMSKTLRELADSMRHMMGRPLMRLLQDANLKNPKHRQIIEEIFIKPLFDESTKYVPRNAIDTFMHGKQIERAMGNSPFIRPAGAVIPRLRGFVKYHPDDLKFLADVVGETNPKLLKYIRRSRTKFLTANMEVNVQRLNADRKLDRYANQMARTYAMYVQDIGDTVRASNAMDVTKNDLKSSHPRAGYGQSIKEGTYYEAIEDLEKVGRTPKGGFSLADVFGMLHTMQPSRFNKRLIEYVLVPHLMGYHRVEYTALKAATTWAKEMVSSFLEGPIGKSIQKYGGKVGDAIVRQGRAWANANDGFLTTTGEASTMTRVGTMLLYSSHLGLNAASAIINATQPLLFAGGWVGYHNLLEGYGRAIARMGRYFADRIRTYGLRPHLSETDKLNLINKHFGDLVEFQAGNARVDFLNIGQSGLELIEGAGMARWARHPTPFDGLFDLTMKMFEKAEWLNRVVTAEAGLAAARKAGLSRPQTALMVDRLVKETQYGGHWMNQPIAFLPGAQNVMSTISPLLLGQNPLMRMFLSFPLRSFTTWVHTTPLLRGGEGLLSKSGALEFLQTTLRGMGISAILHEAGKNILHADLSRAGFAAAVTDILPGLSDGRFDAREGVIPIPPVVDIPFQMFRGLLDGDLEVWRTIFPRLYPGGVALSRALGAVAPQLPDGLDVVLGQRTYADYSAPAPDGSIPIYRADGTLLMYQKPIDMIMRATGADLNRWQEPGKLDQYLLKQREQIIRYEQEFLRKALGNDIDGALAVAREYQRRHGIPLLISSDQLRSAIHVRTTTRTERILDMMSSDVRDTYRNMLASSRAANHLGIDPSLLSAADTSRKRLPPTQRPSGMPTMTPESLDLLIQHLKDAKPEGQESAGFMHQPYNPFVGYR